jgi:hypothetical protein
MYQFRVISKVNDFKGVVGLDFGGRIGVPIRVSVAPPGLGLYERCLPSAHALG